MNQPMRRYPKGFNGLVLYTRYSNDKQAPAYFAGRTDVIADIEDACTLSWLSHLGQAPQMKDATRVIYGAPGAGKSSTLAHLNNTWLDGSYGTTLADGSKRPVPVPVMLYSGSGHLMDTVYEFCEELLNLVAPGSGDELNKTSSEIRRISGRLTGGLASGRIENERRWNLNLVRVGLSAVAKILPPEKWQRPVVIGVDEAQNLIGGKDSETGVLLQELHANSRNLPVVVVLAGLSDAGRRARELGLARLARNHMHSLNCLDQLEVEDLKRGYCSYFGVDLGVHEDRFDHLLAGTQGWPSHIENCLYAFAERYIETSGEIAQVDFDLVEQRSLEFRMNYYYRRMSDEMKITDILLAAVMQQINGKQRKRDVIEIIHDESNRHIETASIGEYLPAEMTAEEFCNHLMHCGALQERNDGIVECPIPSFRQYLIDYPNGSTFAFAERSAQGYLVPPNDQGVQRSMHCKPSVH